MSKLTHNKRIAAKRHRGHGKVTRFSKEEMRERFHGSKVKDFRREVVIKHGERKISVFVDKNDSIFDIRPRIMFDKYHGRPSKFISSFTEEFELMEK